MVHDYNFDITKMLTGIRKHRIFVILNDYIYGPATLAIDNNVLLKNHTLSFSLLLE